MSDNKITRITGVTASQSVHSSPKKENWDTELKAPVVKDTVSSVKTMQLELERSPQNITNQNATLSPKQMADYLSKELARRTAQNKAVKGRGRSVDNIGNELSTILDENKELSSLLESADSDAIAAFLAFFQSAMEKHLSGLEFGDIIYDKELIEQIMSKY